MAAPRILIIDDEADLRELLEITFLKMGLDTDSAGTLAEARELLGRQSYALALTDMRLPDGQGIDLVREIAAHYRGTPVAVITAFGSTDNAVAALKAGAFDYLSKPVALDQLRTMVQSALKLVPGSPLRSAKADEAETGFRLLGESAAMREVRAQIARLARSMAPVAITGESGTGKELAARDIHAQSARADKPFVAVNCGAIPEALMEAEFFGYRKGAFTGAAEDRDGFFQAANGGTLMLDEVADLPLPMQVKLLRAIQERRVRKVGSTVEEPVDVRIISATHQNLASCVEAGKFRQDLYYRLNVIELGLPPLRERADDIALLSGAILNRLSGGTAPALSPAARATLEAYAFPGNVRELENILERALAFASGDAIGAEDLALRPAAPRTQGASPETAPPAPLAPAAPTASVSAAVSPAPEPPAIAPSAPTLPGSLIDHLDAVERDIIRAALDRTRYNRTQAADLLGLTLRQLRYRMQRLDIHEPD
ncbi:sigma-54-dependent transcriptional regulator [Noviherbaspirillum pedocola]|uniref:Sigma-54-dependent Fis family transcriptional regulator n=1 Tax=Noviherbaspirillum pedocola TaxID=2801341 RepID=A0A934SXA7_9BURK|nr:sigma-54 dependent transcriptional regulator [Noviherbaspirillum pedocola]MBK4733493.1 sigma-54-dependent Fis family transcriptional regulator [Noviherbaspirillum pedocola]